MEVWKGALENLVAPSVWRGRKVFLTGHTGFKGGWLALWLRQLGAFVRGYSLDPPTTPNLFSELRLAELVEDIRGDVADGPKLAHTLKEFSPELVFHLAAQPLVRRSYQDPVGTYITNVVGTAHLFEAIRVTSSVKAVVVITTDKCYENREWVWGYREQDPLGGYDPYSSSKACAEILTASYRRSFFSSDNGDGRAVAIATARAGNVVGGGDWSDDRLIPDLIRGFLESKPVRIRNPGAIRPWQHVLDPLAGYLALGQRLLKNEPMYASAWNFGPSDEETWTVGQVASVMAAKWGGGASWETDGLPSPHEATYLKLDASRARAELGWAPKLKLENTLNWVVEWFRAWQNNCNMREFTSRQISSYEKLLTDTVLS